jgi:hypothetical protein
VPHVDGASVAVYNDHVIGVDVDAFVTHQNLVNITLHLHQNNVDVADIELVRVVDQEFLLEQLIDVQVLKWVVRVYFHQKVTELSVSLVGHYKKDVFFADHKLYVTEAIRLV